MSEPVRLSRCVVALLGCSRREAELYIEGGCVLVGGVVVEEPQFLVEGQSVTLVPDARPEPIAPVTILLHKPAGYDSEQGERPAWKLLSADTRTVEHIDQQIRSLRRHFSKLQVPLPLARQASGLLVLTQEWQLNRKLTEEAGRIEQEYVVELSSEIPDEALQELNRPSASGVWRRPGCKVSRQNETRLRFAGRALDADQIDRLCSGAGLHATAIRRIRIGSVSMGKLEPGRWRYLPAFKR
jgi:23S rRNA pseudouridine2604 synthase